MDMQIWLPVIIYGTTVALGLALGWFFLSSRRPPKALQAVHFLTGFGGLEVVMLMAGALVTGLFAGIMAKPRPDVLGPALLAHAMLGGFAFLVLANWAISA